MAIVVIAAVEGALHRTGIAMTQTQTVLDCQYTGAAAHTHDERCYDAVGALVCPLPERELHVHDESCYAAELQLICGVDEGAGAHAHDESCYGAEGVLVCGLEASAGHAHTDECYQAATTLVCEREEVVEEHVHGDECFKTVEVDVEEPPVAEDESASEELADPDAQEDAVTEAAELDTDASDAVDEQAAAPDALIETELSEQEPTDTQVEAAQTQDKAQNVATRVMTAQGRSFHISVTCGPEAGIPQDATLSVTEIPLGTDAHQELIQQALVALKLDQLPEEAVTRCFDICIMDGQDVVEPTAPVTVQITQEADLGSEGLGQSYVVHQDDKGVQVVADAASQAAEDGETVVSTFTADSFSPYATVLLPATWENAAGEYSIPNGDYVIVGQAQDDGAYYALLNNPQTPGRTVRVELSEQDLATGHTIQTAPTALNPGSGTVSELMRYKAVRIPDGSPYTMEDVMWHFELATTDDYYRYAVSSCKYPEQYLLYPQEDAHGNPTNVGGELAGSYQATHATFDYSQDLLTVAFTSERAHSSWRIWSPQNDDGSYTVPTFGCQGMIFSFRAVLKFHGAADGTDGWANLVPINGSNGHGDAAYPAAYSLGTNCDAVYLCKIDELTTVETVDSKADGIRITMKDYAVSGAGIFDQGVTTTNVYITHDLVDRVLGSDGYPVLTGNATYNGGNPAPGTATAGQSLAPLFDSSMGSNITSVTDANHLFLKSVYDEQGYYEYNATQNYAYLDQDTGNFTLYDQLGTPGGQDYNYVYANDGSDYPLGTHDGTFNPDGQVGWYLQRGNFTPYNPILPGAYAWGGDGTAGSGAVLTNEYTYGDFTDAGSIIADDDPKKGWPLYQAQPDPASVQAGYRHGVDYFFGMHINANFTQAEDGVFRGNQMAYEFTGDDDLWLFVDDVLLLDIGGCHMAINGTINFATGVITYLDAAGGSGPDYTANMQTTTIKQRFQEAGIFPDGSAYDEARASTYFSGETFKNFSSHSFDMFYMERGQDASSLHMKFNLPVVPKGSFSVHKELAGAGHVASSQKYAFQALTQDGTALAGATYYGTQDQVEAKDQVTIDGQTYQNVFYLRQGETAVFGGLDVTTSYYVRELGVDAQQYSQVTIEPGGEDAERSGNGVHTSLTDTVDNRQGLVFTNYAVTQDLYIKKAYEGNGFEPAGFTEGDLFSFRVKIQSADGELADYAGEYYLDDETTPRTTTDGVVSGVPVGSSVRIGGLLAGTNFAVEEVVSGAINASQTLADKYHPTFDKTLTQGDGFASAEPSIAHADGVTVAGSNAQIVITNKSYPALRILKVAEGTSTYLADALFSLYRVDGTNEVLVDDALRTVASPDGCVVFQLGQGGYLQDGTYRLRETEAPAGYIMQTADTVLVIRDGKAYQAVGSAQTPLPLRANAYEVTVQNTPGQVLPRTGGVGTTPFIAGGATLCLVSVMTYTTTLWRRRGREVR